MNLNTPLSGSSASDSGMSSSEMDSLRLLSSESSCNEETISTVWLIKEIEELMLASLWIYGFGDLDEAIPPNCVYDLHIVQLCFLVAVSC